MRETGIEEEEGEEEEKEKGEKRVMLKKRGRN